MLLILVLGSDSTITVLSEGVASVHYSKDVARDRAIEDALRRAVEQALGTFISSETIVENYQLIQDRILSRAGGYVAGYRIVSEGIEDGLYRVRILARVRKGELQNDAEAIRTLILRRGRPTLYVDSRVPFVKDFFVSRLREDGFVIIEDTTQRKPDLLLKVDFGEEWEEKDIGYDAGLRLTVLHISARVMDRRTGEVIASYINRKTYPGMNTRLRERFLESAYGEIKGSLLEEWSKGKGLTIVVVKGGDEEFIRNLKDIIQKNVRGLDYMKLKEYREGYGEIEVLASDDAESIYDILIHKLDGVSIHLEGNRITVLLAGSRKGGNSKILR